MVTDRAAALAKAIGELTPESLRATVQYANNRVEADHGRLKARLRPMRGLKRDRTASVVIKGQRSSRMCVAVTTNSAPRPHPCSESQPHSTYSSQRSNERGRRPPGLFSIQSNNATVPFDEGLVLSGDVEEPAECLADDLAGGGVVGPGRHRRT